VAPTLSIFGLTVQAYPLLVLAAVWAGLWLAARQARRMGLEADHVYNMVFYALLATLLGARLAYVLGNWSAYRDSLLAALSPTPSALSWPEGVALGGLVAAIYWLRYRLPAGLTLDALAPGLALGMAVERLGAFLGGRQYGEPTSLPWGVAIGGEVRHPIQLYEMAALLVMLGLLIWQNARRPYSGHTFALFVALYAGSRLFLEAFRADAPLMSGGVRTMQVIALGVLLGAVWYMYRRRFSVVASLSETG
jgi:prolipoprotein diacylglyceryl transferase